jgi:hypothetical protein
MAKRATHQAVQPVAVPTYDVAISFLVADEMIASAIKAGLAGLNVFFYPHNQEDLIGTNGIETMRAPFLDARVNVILFRERYGNTPWTGVELAAIQDSCLRTHYQSLVFVQLDKKDAPPGWLPHTHIRCVLGDFTVDQLVGAIKNKVQERGGTIKPPDALSELQRVRDEQEYLADRDALMRSRQWIEGTVQQGVRDAIAELAQLVQTARSQHGLDIEFASKGLTCVLRSGYVSLGVGWQQPIFNTVADDRGDEAYVCVVEFSGIFYLHPEGKYTLHPPKQLKEHRFKVDVAHDRSLMWREKTKGNQVAAPSLGDRIFRIFLDLISRANNGKVERPFL